MKELNFLNVIYISKIISNYPHYILMYNQYTCRCIISSLVAALLHFVHLHYVGPEVQLC